MSRVASSPRRLEPDAGAAADSHHGLSDQLAPPFPSGASSDPPDVAALAVHIMSNTALTGAT
jgi:hypothetical protein